MKKNLMSSGKNIPKRVIKLPVPTAFVSGNEMLSVTKIHEKSIKKQK